MKYKIGKPTSILIALKSLQKNYDSLCILNDSIYDIEFHSNVEFDDSEIEILEALKYIINTKTNKYMDECKLMANKLITCG